MAKQSLREKRVLLTGASTGIGRALARQLAARGAKLAIAARREPLLEDLAADIAVAGGPAPVVLATDLSCPGSPAALAARAIHVLDGVDILINNAGIGPVGTQATLADGQTARAGFETNFWAPLALASALSPAMRQQGTGAIVNVTSTVQTVPLPLLGYYSAAKAALGQATRALRHELRDTSIRVIEVIPAATDTAARDIHQLPWRDGTAPPTFPPVAPESTAHAVVRAIEKGRKRVVHPKYALLPLELPAAGRLVATLGARRIDTTTRQPRSRPSTAAHHR